MPAKFTARYGKTGDLARISAAVLDARRALDATPTDGAVAEWLGTL